MHGIFNASYYLITVNVDIFACMFAYFRKLAISQRFIFAFLIFLPLCYVISYFHDVHIFADI